MKFLFSDKCAFYLNSPCGSRWVKINEDKVIFQRIKEEK